MNRRNIESSSTISLIFAPILLVIYIYFTGEFSPININPSPAVNSLLAPYILEFQHFAPILSTTLAALLIAIGAAINVMLIAHYNLFGTSSQLPLLLYVCFVAGFTTSPDMLTSAIAALIGVLSLRDFFRTYERSSRTSRLFTACFWMGILPMLYPSTIILWLAIFVLLILFVRSVSDVFVVLSGILLPIILYIYVWWLFGVDITPQIEEFFGTLLYDFTFPSPIRESYAIYPVVLASLALLLMMVTLLQINFMSIRFVARMRNYCAQIFVVLACAMVLLPSFRMDSLVPLAAPLSIAVSPALIRMRGGITFAMLLAILSLAVSFLVAR